MPDAERSEAQEAFNDYLGSEECQRDEQGLSSCVDIVLVPGHGTTDDYGRAAQRQSRIARAARASRPKWVAPVGQITLSVLDQDVQWVDAQGHVVAIDDMEESWKVNIMLYLERNAARFEMMEATSDLFLGAAAGDPYGHNIPDDVVDGIARRTPEQWLESKPLYQRLVKDVYRGQPF